MLHSHILRARWLGLIGLLCGLVLTMLLLTPNQTSVQALPPRPTPVTATPTSVPSSYVREGGLIELQVHPVQTGLWTVVQWQDARGQWHDVDGWQGTLDGDLQVWWVAPRDFGTGPFRWQVYRSYVGSLLATSQSFSLPRRTGATVRIDVGIKP